MRDSRALTATLAAGGLLLAATAPATAGTTGHRRVVSADPVDWTPHVLDGIVHSIAMAGNTVIVGGSFSAVQEAGADARPLPRHNLFAFDARTGRIVKDFDPHVAGPVLALAAGENGTVYAGGAFGLVNGDTQRGLARLRLDNGETVGSFGGAALRDGAVYTMARRGRHLYVGGDFTGVGGAARTALARLDAETGRADPSFTIQPAIPRYGRVKVYSLAVNSRGDRLAVDGAFMELGGLRRPQLGLIDLRRGKVAPWKSEAYAPECKETFPSYVRGLDFSPDGKYFVVVTTGGVHGKNTLCDTAARFETYKTGSRIKPTWVNHTGGDSLYSVAVTGAAVYVGGHQRWMNNPRGRDSAGPGAVSRPGIAALDSRTGRALRWNPTRERGVGVRAFLAHRNGLFVGSDTTELGRERHGRIGMFPMK
ncbi:hypothetical protein [Bailinhaonella thermotolerans]|uniref:PKD domain containing protein n=1 Tax=Bailinhaonella thermotolerans TaxID=1070861 RepID=A0A3A4AAR2_9ACTN|nr:hypothetical protein [Bailinhaonella thermotolerans]RJL22508.1 hypothetical protein D5H75_35400 [Bailinhaonella thermotolerans]